MYNGMLYPFDREGTIVPCFHMKTSKHYLYKKKLKLWNDTIYIRIAAGRPVSIRMCVVLGEELPSQRLSTKRGTAEKVNLRSECVTVRKIR